MKATCVMFVEGSGPTWGKKSKTFISSFFNLFVYKSQGKRTSSLNVTIYKCVSAVSQWQLHDVERDGFIYYML